MTNGDFGLRFAAVVLILALAPAAAKAYIDPGNGAYMVQALFTVVGAALFYLRHPLRSIKVFWHRFFGGVEANGNEFSSDGPQEGRQGLASPEASAAGSKGLGDGN